MTQLQCLFSMLGIFRIGMRCLRNKSVPNSFRISSSRSRTHAYKILKNIQLLLSIKSNYCWVRFGCWPACCWSSYLWWSTPSFSGDLLGSVLISSTVMKNRRIVIHQRNLEKWRQEQLKEKKNESTAEVSSGEEISKQNQSHRILTVEKSPFSR